MIVSLIGGFLVSFHTLIWGLRRLPLSVLTEEKRRDRTHPGWLFLLAFFSIAAVYLAYFFCVAYPGYFTTDSFASIGQNMSGVFDNSTPYYYTYLVGLCLKIGIWLGGRGNSAVCVYGISQCLIMSAVFAYTVVTLYQAGVPRWSIACVYCLYAFLSYNMALAATMWKDIPFSGAVLLVVTSMYRILRKVGKRKGLNDALFILGGIGICLMRTNGWHVFLAVAVILGLSSWRAHKRLLLVMCGVLAATWVFIHPVLDQMGVKQTDFVEALAVPFQQMSRVIVEEREVAPPDMEMLGRIFEIEKVKELYDPLTVDPVKFEAFRHGERSYLRENMGEYVRLWMRLGWRHPWTYLKAWVDETQGYWNAGYHFWIYPAGGESAKYGITRSAQVSPVASVFNRWFHFIEGTPPLTQPLYGIGFQVWILIFCFLVCVTKKRKEFLLAIPALVIVVGLWFGTPVFAEFRYAYPVFLTVPFLLNVTAFQVK